jgi:hydrogenase maturation factor HypE
VVRRRVGVGVADGDAEDAGTRDGVPEAKAVAVPVGWAVADPDADVDMEAEAEAAHGVAETDGDRPGDCDEVVEPARVLGLALTLGVALVLGLALLLGGSVLAADRDAEAEAEADEVGEGVLVTHGAGVGMSAPTAPMATMTDVVAAAMAATRTAIARGIVRRAWSILGSPVRLGSGPVGGGSAYRGLFRV